MQSTYNLGPVAVSLAVATLASYTALDLAGRISTMASASRPPSAPGKSCRSAIRASRICSASA
ncbi:hypothetical protein [Paraburkholderia sp. LEh10]|uniref:hypothetical protein n=1 Tax=Paraburkholderia sp. LEh10 TaxID=2821353 RepID=UPI003917CFDD